MIAHIIVLVIGIVSCIVSGWMVNSIIINLENGNKIDKLLVFWGIYSFVTGVFLIVRG